MTTRRTQDLETLTQLFSEGRISRREFCVYGVKAGASLSLLGGLLAACSSSPSSSGSPSGAPTTGGTLVTGVVNAVGAFDPHGWGGFTSNIVTNHVYQSLVRLNFETSEIEPALAESWDNPDPLTYVYTLRQGVKFHNGEELTADDVVFSVNRAKEVSWGAYGLAQFESITAKDTHTVEVKLSNPDWTFKWFFYWPPGSILSKKYFETAGDEEATAKPVGTGAFKFVSSSSSEVQLEKFADYWEDGLPKLDKVTLKVVDPSTLLAALKTGEMQLSPDVGFDQLDTVSGFADVGVMAKVGPHIVQTYLNTTEKPFDDVKVRQAMAEALDNVAALSAYPTEWYQPSKGAWIHPSFEFSAADETDAVYTSNLDKAKGILAGSSVPNGFSATWTVAATRPQEVSAALGAQERLKEIGIKVEIEQKPDPDVAGATYTRPRPFQIITYNWLHNQPHALDPMAALLTTGALDVSNFSGYSNPEYDKLVADAYVATDDAEIGDKLHQLQLIHIRDVPLLVHGWDGIRRVQLSSIESPPQTILAEWDDWYRTTAFTA
jgi:peptide/nickel transport system substrate-binding protein